MARRKKQVMGKRQKLTKNRLPISRQKITLSSAGNVLVGGRRVSPSQLGGIITAKKHRGEDITISLPKNEGVVTYRKGTMSKRHKNKSLYLTHIKYDGKEVSERFGFVQYRYTIPEPESEFVQVVINDANKRGTKPVTVFYGVVEFTNEAGDDVGESTKTYATYYDDSATEMASRLQSIIDTPRSNKAVVSVNRIQLRMMQER